MKTKHKEFLDDLARLFKKHGVGSMITIDPESSDSEGEHEIKFSIGYDDIIVGSYFYGDFREVTAPDNYKPDLSEDAEDDEEDEESEGEDE